MAAFAIVFGTRNIDAAEHHQGMVAAVAFESVVKLLSFLAVGVMVVWGIHDGFADLFDRTAEHPEIARLLTAEPALGDGSWITVTLLSMAAIICLPRQFQMMIVENVREAHLRRALWLFPLYMLLINLFVLPVAVTGLMHFQAGTVDPDMFVLALPLSQGWKGAGIVRLRGRVVGGHQHDHRRDGGAEHDGVERSGDPGAAAPQPAQAGPPPRPYPAAAGDPADRHPDDPADGLRVFPVRRQRLCAGRHRPDLLHRRRPVRAGPDRRHLLERRNAARSHHRADRRDSGLDLYAPAAVVRPLRLARPRFPVQRSRWYGTAAALRAVRPGRAGPAVARAVLEHGAECRALCRGVAVRPAQRRRTGPGQRLRRRVPDDGAGDRGLVFLARQHDGRRA